MYHQVCRYHLMQVLNCLFLNLQKHKRLLLQQILVLLLEYLFRAQAQRQLLHIELKQGGQLNLYTRKQHLILKERHLLIEMLLL